MTFPIIPENTPINLQDNERWRLRVTLSLRAPFDPKTQSASRIPEAFPPQTFNSPILATQAVIQAQYSGSAVGRILRIQRSSLGSGSNIVTSGRRIWRGLQLITFNQDLIGGFQLRFLAYRRIPDVTLLIYEYL
ncbi:MAG: hypothetical protein AAGF26_02685 [Cyanobacteria bacterium P01_G01_bin.49]